MSRDELFIDHIREAIERIALYLQGVSRPQFIANPMVQDAVIRQLEIIGEAARNLSEDVRSGPPDVEWAQIIGLRNRLTHAYFQVDVDVVWEIATVDIPLLKQQLREIR